LNNLKVLFEATLKTQINNQKLFNIVGDIKMKITESQLRSIIREELVNEIQGTDYKIGDKVETTYNRKVGEIVHIQLHHDEYGNTGGATFTVEFDDGTQDTYNSTYFRKI
jgi:hypothetical protein